MQIDIETLKPKSNTSAAYKAVFTYLSTKERHRGDTDLRKLHRQFMSSGAYIGKQELLEVFTEMQSLGIGKLHSNDTKFNWFVSPVKVGKMLADKPIRKEIQLKTNSGPGIIIRVGNATVETSNPEEAVKLLKLLA